MHTHTYEKGRAFLRVTLKKALYGCLRLALLFYERLVAEIRGKGFELNPYDPFVANKMIGGKQIIVFWHMDDLKVSHVDPKEVTKFMEWIEKVYGDLRIKRGKVHKYLGMKLDFWTPGELRLTMVD